MRDPFLVANPTDAFDGLSYLILVAALIAAAAWGVVFAFRFIASAPKLPDAGPSTNELGPEPPAVVNLLVNRWRLTGAALQATLVDLAARRHLGIEEYVDKNIVVRVRPDPGNDQLTPYERQVLDLVRRRATGGSAPVQALNIGDQAQASSFTKEFRKSVISDARGRGLVRNRWSPADWSVLGVGLAIVAGLFALAFGEAGIARDAANPDSDSSFDRGDWLIAGAVAWGVGMAALGSLRDIRDTPAGRKVAGAWLGVRIYLDESNAFEEVTPAAVTVWGRHMAYAVATGTAHEASRLLPLAPEEPETAWSRHTGVWRQIRVEYPARFGFGEMPVKVFLAGFLRTVFFGAVAFVVLPIVASVLWDLKGEFLKSNQTFESENTRAIKILAIFGVGGFSAVGALLLSQLTRGLVRLVRGGLDLGRTTTLEGSVVKVHGGRFAVDNGQAGETDALIPALAQLPPLGAKVRVTLSPHLKYVSRVEVLAPPAQPPPSAAVPLAEGPAVAHPILELIPLTMVQAVTGLATLAPSTEKHPLDGSGRFQAWDDAAGNKVRLGHVMLTDPAAGPVSKVLWAAQKLSRTKADGIPDAWWMGDGNLFIKRDDRIVIVSVDFPGPQREAERRAASALAERVPGVVAPAPGSPA